MKYKDYKISQVNEVDGETTAVVRFYEGDFRGVIREGVTVNEYQRDALLETKTYIFVKVVTLDDIRKYLNKEMDADVKVGRYKVLDEQRHAIPI